MSEREVLPLNQGLETLLDLPGKSETPLRAALQRRSARTASTKKKSERQGRAYRDGRKGTCRWKAVHLDGRKGI